MKKTNQKQDRRVKKTENAIYEAFDALLSEKKYSEITVKELTEMADINRKTFYLHYETLDDVLYEFMLERFENINSEICAEGVDLKQETLINLDEDGLVKVLSGFRRSLEREDLKISLMIKDETIRRTINQILAEKQKELWETYQEHFNLDPEVAKVYAIFTTYGFNAAFMRWYTGSDSLPLEKFAKMLWDIVVSLRGLPEKWEKSM